ncbi:hypothetical protein YSY22_38420 [Brevibacillus formosus]
MNELTYLTATEMGTWIRERKISAEEATRHSFKRINSLNGKVNAIVAYDEKGAFEAAKQADKEIGEGIYRGPLHGVPITIKDSFATAGLATTSGFPPLKGYIPQHDSAIVSRLKQAGAIILGKTNVPPVERIIHGIWREQQAEAAEDRQPPLLPGFPIWISAVTLAVRCVFRLISVAYLA